MGATSTLIASLAWLVFGAASAGAGLLLGTGAAPTTPTTSAPAPAVVDRPPAAHWVAAGETVLGPTVLLPLSLETSGGEVVFEYDLVDIAPRPRGWRGRDEVAGAAVVAPERWTLLTDRGDLPGTTANPRARAARFAVSDDFTRDEVRGIRLDAWRMRMPATFRVDLPHGDAGDHAVDDGTSVALKLLLEQSNATVVQVRVTDRRDGFSAATGSFLAAFEAAPAIAGLGAGWENIGVTEGGIQLTFVGDELPDPIPIAVRTHDWIPLERPVLVDLTGLAG